MPRISDLLSSRANILASVRSVFDGHTHIPAGDVTGKTVAIGSSVILENTGIAYHALDFMSQLIYLQGNMRAKKMVLPHRLELWTR